MCEINKYLDFTFPADYAATIDCIEKLCEDYPSVSVSYIGESLCGRAIPCLRIGSGARNILYVGAHHAMEWITSQLLLRYIRDLACAAAEERRCWGTDPSYMLQTRSIYVIPMLNPDGVELQQHGRDDKNPLWERILSMNGGSDDFSHWQANGRGVDLNHNYNYGFGEYKQIEAQMSLFGGASGKYSGEYPESEPETAAVCSFIRTIGEFDLLLTLHTQGEEIFYDCNGKCPPRGLAIGRAISELTGYRLSKPEGGAAYGGLKDWYIEEYNAPAYTIECGRGENPLPVEDGTAIYAAVRHMLYIAPLLR